MNVTGTSSCTKLCAPSYKLPPLALTRHGRRVRPVPIRMLLTGWRVCAGRIPAFSGARICPFRIRYVTSRSKLARSRTLRTRSRLMTTCNGICLTGADIGVPATEVAYAHPECELHSNAVTKENEVPTYRVHLRQTVHCAVIVKADDKEAAIDAAVQTAPTALCAVCSGWSEPWTMDLTGEWEVDRLPGENDSSAVECVS